MLARRADHDLAPSRRRAMAVLAIVLVGLVVQLHATAADAHPSDATLVTVVRRAREVVLEVQAPITSVDAALGTTFAADPTGALATQASRLQEIVLGSIEVVGESGVPWRVQVEHLGTGTVDGTPRLQVGVVVTPAGGEAAASFALTYRFLTDQLPAHDVYVADGEGAAHLLGTINHRHPSIAVRLAQPRSVGLRPMIEHGIAHFRTGTDHIVFITLLAAGTAFAGGPPRARARALAGRSTAFTLGHSVSLSLAVSGLVTPPSRPVEIAIAATVLLAAANVARPVVPARAETAIALIFGLVHGFGFSGTLTELGLHGYALVVPTVGFNIGLEAAQLAADLVLSLPLWWLARRRWARPAIAVPCGVVAVAWIVQRTWAVSNPVDGMVDVLVATPERLAIALALLAATPALLARVRGSASIAASRSYPDLLRTEGPRREPAAGGPHR